MALFLSIFLKYKRTILINPVSFVSSMAVIQSFWFFLDNPLLLNFLSQNLGFSTNPLKDLLTSRQFVRSFKFNIMKMFLAISSNPGLLIICSIFLKNCLKSKMLRILLQFLATDFSTLIFNPLFKFN